MTSRVVAIATGDVHLSLVPPGARAEEPSWLEAMQRPWDEIKALADHHRCPVLVAGDLFDRWGPPCELVTWALEHLPTLWAIPGNHDLPGHNPRLVHKSAFGTLVRAGKVVPLGPRPRYVHELALYGTRLGHRPPHAQPDNGLALRVLLTHEYIWTAGTGHRRAPREQRLDKVARKFHGWDVVVCGDNHIGFDRKLKGGTTLVNCGTLMRRKSDEAHYQPSVALINLDGSVSRHHLDISKDIITEVVHDDAPSYSSVPPGFETLTRELNSRVPRLDFRTAIRRALDRTKTTVEARAELLRAMGD